MFYDFGKRTFDITFSLLLLFILSPIILMVSIILLFFQGRPIFFKQVRVGRDENLFRIFKFRTMRWHNNKPLLENDEAGRITKIGRILRKFSIDELPELVNVILGDMSIVGPRPLLPEYLPLYTTKQRVRHCVRPGITGWAQINGRNSLSWTDRFELDVWYVHNRSFKLDLLIMIKTFAKIINNSDVDGPNGRVGVRFTGDN